MGQAVPKIEPSQSKNSRIRVLSEFVINQISAGEVVERPASVVRELLDNSLDAGASDISIFIEDGGRRSIRVVDDGSGMSKDDALLAFENHATSKVSEVKDLSAIETFGFRGEALASIAAVSKVQLKTRTKTSDIGIRVVIEGGKLVKVEPVACNPGTEIIVSNIFYNTPARRKFLKKSETEEAKIKQWIIQSAAPNYSIRYRYNVDGKEVLNFPSVDTLLERSKAFVRGNCMPVNWQRGSISINGLVGHPGSASTSAASLVLIANKRVVRDGLIMKAVREGFSSTLKSYESPVGVISITLPPSQLDVNVHPQKSEVRFLAPGEIFVAVRDGVLNAVNHFTDPITVTQTTHHQSSYENSLYREKLNSKLQDPNFVEPTQSSFSLRSKYEPVAEISYQSISEDLSATDTKSRNIKFRYGDLKFIGQIFECYLLCEKDEIFYILDMHAAHERCNYNRIREGFLEGKVSEQMLLTPVVVRLGSESKQNLLDNISDIKRWGFEIEAFGTEEVIVRSAPSFVAIKDIPSLIKEMAEEFLSSMAGSLVSETIDHIAARIACHGSIRSGKIMSKEESYALLSQLDQAELAGACPHGRPVMVQFPLATVEKWFGRDR